MKKIFSKKNIIIFLIIVVLVVIFYFTYNSMNQKINEAYFYVVFDTNGGTRIPAEKVKINELATLPEPPTKKGYTFKYWTLDKVEYDFNTKVRNNMTLVAVWEESKEDKKEETESQGSGE